MVHVSAQASIGVAYFNYYVNVSLRVMIQFSGDSPWFLIIVTIVEIFNYCFLIRAV